MTAAAAPPNPHGPFLRGAPTEEQAAILSDPLAPGTILTILAAAGAGKSSTTLDLLRRFIEAAPPADPPPKILFLVFNKMACTDTERAVARAGLDGCVFVRTIDSVVDAYQRLKSGGEGAASIIRTPLQLAEALSEAAVFGTLEERDPNAARILRPHVNPGGGGGGFHKGGGRSGLYELANTVQKAYSTLDIVCMSEWGIQQADLHAALSEPGALDAVLSVVRTRVTTAEAYLRAIKVKAHKAEDGPAGMPHAVARAVLKELGITPHILRENWTVLRATMVALIVAIPHAPAWRLGTYAIGGGMGHRAPAWPVKPMIQRAMVRDRLRPEHLPINGGPDIDSRGFRVVVVDEAQDCHRWIAHLINQCVEQPSPTAALVVVCDPNQSINAWAGAVVPRVASPGFARTHTGVIRPYRLMQSHRFGANLPAVLHSYIPPGVRGVPGRETVVDHQLDTVAFLRSLPAVPPEGGMAVLAAKNRQLALALLMLYSMDTTGALPPAIVNVIGLIEVAGSARADVVNDMARVVGIDPAGRAPDRSWVDTRAYTGLVEAARSRDKTAPTPQSTIATWCVALVYETLQSARQAHDLGDVRDRVRPLMQWVARRYIDRRLAGCKTPLLTFSTGHAAKGREWGRVHVLGDAEPGNLYAPTASRALMADACTRQECNLWYVIMTRVRDHLSHDPKFEPAPLVLATDGDGAGYATAFQPRNAVRGKRAAPYAKRFRRNAAAAVGSAPITAFFAR